MRKIYYFLVLNIVWMSVACSEEEDSLMPTMTNAKLLVKSWMLQQTYVSIPSLGYEQILYNRDDTELLYTMYDSHYDRIVYNLDGTFLSNGDWSVEVNHGTWEFNDDETQLMIDKDTKSERRMYIMQLTDFELIYEEYMTEDEDTISTYRVHMIPEYQ